MDENLMSVIVRAIIEKLLSDTRFNAVLEEVAAEDYTCELFCQDLVNLMGLIADWNRGTFNDTPPAERNTFSGMPILLEHLNHLSDGSMSQTLVRESAYILKSIIQALGEKSTQLFLPGYHLKILDSTVNDPVMIRADTPQFNEPTSTPDDLSAQAIDCNEHLMVLDPQLGLVTNYLSRHGTQVTEQVLVDRILSMVRADDVWIVSDNFCSLTLLYGIEEREAYFVMRPPPNLSGKALAEWQQVGNLSKDQIFEQHFQLESHEKALIVRRVLMRLDQPTRQGVKEVMALTNLPISKIYAQQVIQVSQYRWNSLNSLFSSGRNLQLNQLLQTAASKVSQIHETQAVQWITALVLIAHNLLTTAIVLLRYSTYQGQQSNNAISYAYLAAEVQNYYANTVGNKPAAVWRSFGTMDLPQLCHELKRLAYDRLQVGGLSFRNPNLPNWMNLMSATLRPLTEPATKPRRVRTLPDWIYLQVSTDLDALDSVLTWFEQLKEACSSESIWLQCKIALAEGFTNAVRYTDSATPIELEASLVQHGVEIRIWDKGKLFNLWEYLEQLPQHFSLQEGGYGLKLMQEIADYLNYIRTGDNYNCLLIIKYF